MLRHYKDVGEMGGGLEKVGLGAGWEGKTAG